MKAEQDLGPCQGGAGSPPRPHLARYSLQVNKLGRVSLGSLILALGRETKVTWAVLCPITQPRLVNSSSCPPGDPRPRHPVP